MKSRYENSGTCWIGKTKPIQTQFKPNKAKNKPNLTQFKAKTKPISNDINDLDNNLPNCYISLSEFLYGQIVKIGKGII